MKEQGRIEELLAESLQKQDRMLEVFQTLIEVQRQTNIRVDRGNELLQQLVVRVEQVEENQLKAVEKADKVSQALDNLSDRVERLLRLEQRVAAIERIVFKQ